MALMLPTNRLQHPCPVNIAASIRSHGLLSDLTGFATVAGIWPRWGLQPWKAKSIKSARTPGLGAKTRGFMGLYLSPHEKAAVVVAVTPSRSTRAPSTSNSTSRTGLQVDIARWAEQPTVVRRRNDDRTHRSQASVSLGRTSKDTDASRARLLPAGGLRAAIARRPRPL
jgi:hypothetical protein